MEYGFTILIAIVLVMALLLWTATEEPERDPSDTGDYGDIG